MQVYGQIHVNEHITSFCTRIDWTSHIISHLSHTSVEMYLSTASRPIVVHNNHKSLAFVQEIIIKNQKLYLVVVWHYLVFKDVKGRVDMITDGVSRYY